MLPEHSGGPRRRRPIDFRWGEEMALFTWNEQLSVGNGFIDGDHKKLIKLVNDFHDAMEQGRGNDVIGKVLNNLIIYTREHFTREEVEMQRIRYSRYLAHKQEHDKLIREVLDLQANFANGTVMLSIKVSKFLREWLVNHIQKTDKILAEALTAC
jgi:hemerythrin-like metal-binding protein